MALLSLDIDHFKEVNDRLDHAAGDLALRHTAQILTALVSGTDIAARIGGEEFALACPNTSPTDARHFAERLHCAIEAGPIEHNGTQIAFTISIGLAFRLPGDDVADLLERADIALYSAKQAGRNRIGEWQAEAPLS